MTGDATTAPPWRRLGDSDYMAPKVIVWATLLGRAWDALEQVEDQLRDVPGADVAHGRLAEAMQLVGIVTEEIRPHSVFLTAPSGADG